MATVWIVPAGSDTAPDAGNGDFLLRTQREPRGGGLGRRCLHLAGHRSTPA